MKRAVSATLIFSPLAFMLFLRWFPEYDTASRLPLFHFYIVTFTTFAAAVVSIILTLALGENARPRHLLASVAFAAIGSIFFSHGLATQGALITEFHPAISWSAWLTLLVGGILFTLASLEGENGFPRGISIRGILRTTTIAIFIYFAIALFAHEWLDQIGELADPWHKLTIFTITLIFWLIASVRFFQLWRKGKNSVDGVLSFVAFWLAMAAISMHRFPVWNLSWWLYHLLLLLGFLVTIVVLLREYEQARQFNLLRYYLAISLIFTALLALTASDLFARNAFDTLTAELDQHARQRIADLTNGVAATINPSATPAEALDKHVHALKILPALAVLVYDANSHLVYALNGDYGPLIDDTGTPQEILIHEDSRASYEAALAGNTLVTINEPGGAPEGYAPPEDVHTLVTYAPLYATPPTNGTSEIVIAPIGVVELIEEAPELTSETHKARVAGLGITALTMSVLFAALLLVVRRADGILSTRTSQLNQAFDDLQRSESLRDDLTRMIVHDLRNPLSAISASVDLLRMTSGQDDPAQAAQFTSMASDAAKRMSNLVDDILTVSKYEAGELTLNVQDGSVARMLVENVAGFEAQAEAEGKSIRISCPPDLRASLDYPLIGRVIENLVGNALKYVDSGSGMIEVSAAPQSGRLEIHVRDNGEGIPNQYKVSIFEKYVQVPDESNRSIRKGTGLGLAFCRMVIQSHGGEILVQDTEGGGSDFVFWVAGR